MSGLLARQAKISGSVKNPVGNRSGEENRSRERRCKCRSQQKSGSGGGSEAIDRAFPELKREANAGRCQHGNRRRRPQEYHRIPKLHDLFSRRFLAISLSNSSSASLSASVTRSRNEASSPLLA